MGAGKTTVARQLARMTGGGAVDLDDFVTAREGRSPQSLIDEEGEAVFREKETEALRAALTNEGARIVALGGGAWALARNRNLIEEHDCLTVWLDAPFELCWRRISKGAISRPLARDLERARRLYDERIEAYSIAALRIPITRDRNARELAAEILRALDDEGNAPDGV